MDVDTIRRCTGLSHNRFAAKYGFAAVTVRNWKKDRRQSERTARLLLKVGEKHPEAVEGVLAEA